MRKMTREIQNFEKYTYMYVYVCCFFPRSRAVMRNNVDSSNDKSKDLGGLITMVLVCVYQNPHLVNSWFELYYKQLHALDIIRTKFINIVDSSNCSCEKWEDTYHFFLSIFVKNYSNTSISRLMNCSAIIYARLILTSWWKSNIRYELENCY